MPCSEVGKCYVSSPLQLDFILAQNAEALSTTSFCILGKDHVKLVNKNEEPLKELTVIYDLAGTGKTIPTKARITHQRSTECRIFVTLENNAITW